MKIVKLFGLASLFVFLTGCQLDLSENSDDSSNTIETFVTVDEITELGYSLDVDELEEYLASLEDADTVVTSSLVLSSVVEVAVEIEYSYTSSMRMPGGFSNTVTDTITSSATAFFINADGYLVTNAHVVSMDEYSNIDGFEIISEVVIFNFADSDDVFTASVVDYDNDLDLAVLKSDIVWDELEYLTFFDISEENELYYGEEVLAVGNANGYGISVTTGVVSAPLRYFDDGNDLIEAIQTDAAINEGNSGGPLTNMYGNVIGINSFKIITDTSESLGYAIPSNVVTDYLDSIEVTYSTTNVRGY